MENTFDNNIEIKKPNLSNIALKWALIGILLTVISTMLSMYLNDGKFNPRSGGLLMFAINMTILVFPMTMAIKEYRDKEMEGYIPFSGAFKAGFVYSLFLILFNLIFMLVFYNFIIDFDAFVADQVDIGIQSMKERGMSDEEIKKALDKSPAFFSTQTFSLMVVVLVGLIIDTIVALILAAILKRNRPANA